MFVQPIAEKAYILIDQKKTAKTYALAENEIAENFVSAAEWISKNVHLRRSLMNYIGVRI